MKKLIVISLVLISSSILAQTPNSYAERSIFSDYKAARLGDAITIIVIESSQASNQAQTQTGRSSDVGFNFKGKMSESDLPNIDLNVGSNNDFKGGGKTQSSGMVKTRISALVDSVLSNGLVRVNGSRRITINGEVQEIKIKGLVRTADIMSGNTVYSYNISEAEIVFDGEGKIESNQSPGWLTKVFHWLF